MITCPVCGMDIDQTRVKYKTLYKGRIYYFCSRTCFNKFNSNPDYYIEHGPGDMSRE